MVARVTVDIADAVRRSQRRLETLAHEFTQDLAETTIERTPVVTGNLRSHWFTSINDANVSFANNIESAAQTIARVSVAINTAQLGDTINVLNGAAYAEFVEFGTQSMAPRAFVRSTVGDAAQILEATVRRIAVT